MGKTIGRFFKKTHNSFKMVQNSVHFSLFGWFFHPQIWLKLADQVAAASVGNLSDMSFHTYVVSNLGTRPLAGLLGHSAQNTCGMEEKKRKDSGRCTKITPYFIVDAAHMS